MPSLFCVPRVVLPSREPRAWRGGCGVGAQVGLPTVCAWAYCWTAHLPWMGLGMTLDRFTHLPSMVSDWLIGTGLLLFMVVLMFVMVSSLRCAFYAGLQRHCSHIPCSLPASGDLINLWKSYLGASCGLLLWCSIGWFS